MKKINLMYLTGSLCFGGLERVIVNQCKAIDRSLFEPLVVCTDVKGELAPELEAEGIPVIGLDCTRRRFGCHMVWREVRKIAVAHGTHIVHSHNTGPFIDAFFTVAFSPMALIHTDHARSFPDKWRYMLLERLVSLRADKIVAVSFEAKNHLMRYEHISSRRINVVQNGIDGDRFDIRIDVGRKKQSLNLTDFDHIVGLCARLSEEKGPIHLVEAARRVLEQFPRTGFLIAGNGPMARELQARTMSAGLNNNVIFLGGRTDVPELLQLMDIYTLPSLREGLPLGILEAMAARRCIVASSVGEIPFVIRDGLDGVLISPGTPGLLADTLLALLRDPERRKSMGESAHQRFLKHFTVQKMMQEYETLYKAAYRRRSSVNKRFSCRQKMAND
jgi:glycosyltransferase involved in cell wall biosynthesis